MKIMTDTIPKWQRVTGWMLSGILAIVFLPSAFFKIAQPKGFDRPGEPDSIDHFRR
jgi:hypothetical protein